MSQIFNSLTEQNSVLVNSRAVISVNILLLSLNSSKMPCTTTIVMWPKFISLCRIHHLSYNIESLSEWC